MVFSDGEVVPVVSITVLVSIKVEVNVEVIGDLDVTVGGSAVGFFLAGDVIVGVISDLAVMIMI